MFSHSIYSSINPTFNSHLMSHPFHDTSGHPLDLSIKSSNHTHPHLDQFASAAHLRYGMSDPSLHPSYQSRYGSHHHLLMSSMSGAQSAIPVAITPSLPSHHHISSHDHHINVMPLLAFNHSFNHSYNNDMTRSFAATMHPTTTTHAMSHSLEDGITPSALSSTSVVSFSDHLQRLREQHYKQQLCCNSSQQQQPQQSQHNYTHCCPQSQQSFDIHFNSQQKHVKNNSMKTNNNNSYVWNPIANSNTNTTNNTCDTTKTQSNSDHVINTEVIVINSDSDNNSDNSRSNTAIDDNTSEQQSIVPTTTTTTSSTIAITTTTTTTTTTTAVNVTSSATTTVTSSSAVTQATPLPTKQLKDYKLLLKQNNNNNKNITKETKTVEVQCDGPDWTPIVLPQQLKNKLQKAIQRRKRRIIESLEENNKSISISMTTTNKRKKCKQKHKHNSNTNHKQRSCESSHKHERRSPHCSSSSSSSSSSSVSSMSCSSSKTCSVRKRSMLECLMNSSGYIGDQLKKNEKSGGGSGGGGNESCNLFATDPRQLSREERALLRAIKHFEKLEKPEQETEVNTENNSINNEKKKIEEKSQTNDDLSLLLVNKSNKIKAKNKLRKRLLEKRIHETINNNNEKTKQKKTGMSHVTRRRRFRSGLDMIRRPNGNRKKKQLLKKETTTAVIVKKKKNTMIGMTSQSQSSSQLRLMVNKALGETVLHRAARTNRMDVVVYCLSSLNGGTRVECDINARDNAGYTPLHECCTRGHLLIAKILLQNNADVNASAAGGIRPLHDAVENDHIEVVRLLLSYGADPNISTYSGSTPLTLSRSKQMTLFIKGFLNDISCDQNNNKDVDSVLPWKFNNKDMNGFDVLDTCDLNSDDQQRQHVLSREFVFEMSSKCFETCNTFQFKNKQLIRFKDLLLKTNFQTKQQFIQKYPKIELISINNKSTCFNQLLTIFQKPMNETLINEEFVVFDENIKHLLDIKSIKL